MSQTLALHPAKKRDAIFLWVLLGWLAFILLPSWSLDYGLLESTTDSIRDVIAFPKTQRAQCLLTQAPSTVDEKQLRELHIRLRNEPKKEHDIAGQ